MKPRVKIRERKIVPKVRPKAPKPRLVGKRKVYDPDYRRRKRRSGHYTGADLKVWMLFWNMSPLETARLLNTTEKNVKDVVRRTKFLPNHMDNILQGIWFQNPRTFPTKKMENRVYFCIDKPLQWWALQDMYNWGMEIKDLIFFRCRGRGCRVVHRPTGLSAYFRNGTDFDYNRRWAMKKLADEYYDMVTIRQNNERLRELWRNTLKKETGIQKTVGWSREPKKDHNSNSTAGENVNVYGCAIAEPGSQKP